MSDQMNTQERVVISKETLINDFRNMYAEKLPAEVTKETIAAINRQSNSYYATGKIASMVFYTKVSVEVKKPDDGSYRQGAFIGDAGGIALLGGGGLWGDVYTDNLERLYRDTVSFAFTATPVYTAVYFYNSESELLGHYQAGALSILNTGAGGGPGHWRV